MARSAYRSSFRPAGGRVANIWTHQTKEKGIKQSKMKETVGIQTSVGRAERLTDVKRDISHGKQELVMMTHFTTGEVCSAAQ
jgi:hypothetical protein